MSAASSPEISATLAASQPIISVASAPRSRASRDGWLIAISTRSTSSASGDWKTLACDSSTLPISSRGELALHLAALRVGADQHRDVAGLAALRSPMVMRPAVACGDEPRDFGGASPARRTLLASVLATGSPSGVCGSVHTCRSARFAVLSAKGLRALSPIATG